MSFYPGERNLFLLDLHITMNAVIFCSISPLIFLPVNYCSTHLDYWCKLCSEVQILKKKKLKRADPQLASEFALADTQLSRSPSH